MAKPEERFNAVVLDDASRLVHVKRSLRRRFSGVEVALCEYEADDEGCQTGMSCIRAALTSKEEAYVNEWLQSQHQEFLERCTRAAA